MNTTTQPPKTKPTRMDAQEVMDSIATQLPEILGHIHADGDWLWYTGPSLQSSPATRLVLKDIGFRFAPRGHVMPEGNGIGSWGHSCLRPTPRRRKGDRRAATADTPEAHAVDPTAALAALFA
jgi:hypothetical protein